MARATIWELGGLALDDPFLELGLAADQEATQLRAIATQEDVDADVASARADAHLQRLDQLLVAAARHAAERCTSIANGLALLEEWDLRVDVGDDVRRALAVSRRLSTAAERAS